MEHLDETTIALFIERRLPGERIEKLESHIDQCSDCRRLVAELGRSQAPFAMGSAPPIEAHVLQRGARIGRYVVLDRIGAGAMGTVYAAFDPDLDRKVAVKLLHAGDSARLLREAQALARISHPGVVAIHDVGTHEGHVFIAIAFVAGGTFRAWVETPRSWRAIVGVAVQVAHGLAAVHAAGLVHRDVKPDNILVDAEGVARIGDFGLAAGVGEPERPSDPLLAEAKSALSAELTASNAIVGTPAYMAPEQLAGDDATARSDQFGLCATIYEALFGVRPYPGRAIGEIRERMAARRVAEPKHDRAVPKRIRAALVRGLELDPAARFATMNDLVEALAFDPRGRRRIVIAAIAGLAVIGAGAAYLVAKTRDGTAPCSTAPAELARVFTPAKRTQIRDAILATGLPFAADTAKRVEAALATYGTSWVGQHEQACKATAVHETQSPAMLDRRMSCLDRRLIDLEAALDTLATTDHERVRHAVDVATQLPSPALCADPDRLSALPPPAQAAQVADISREVARAHALLHVAQPDKADEAAARAVEAADKLGYGPLQAEALDARGNTQHARGDHRAARESFERAVLAATKSGDIAVEARALGSLALILRDTSPDGGAALAHARHALALAERTGRDPALEAKLHLAIMRIVAGSDLNAFHDHYKRGRERLAAATNRDTRTLKLEYDVIDGKAEPDPDRAVEKQRAALVLAEEIYGASHPRVAEVLYELAHMAATAGRTEEARAHAKRISAILDPYPGDPVEVRRIDALLEPDPKKRRPILEEVVKATEATAPKSVRLALDREELANVLLELGEWRAGLVQVDAAIAIYDALYGGHYEGNIMAYLTKAQLHAGLEEWAAVAVAAERANSIVDNGGMREVMKVLARLLLLDSYFRQRRFEEVISLIATYGDTMRRVLLEDPATKILDFYVAAAHWELGRDRPGSLAKAKAALAVVKTSRAADPETLGWMRAWLKGK